MAIQTRHASDRWLRSHRWLDQHGWKCSRSRHSIRSVETLTGRQRSTIRETSRRTFGQWHLLSLSPLLAKGRLFIQAIFTEQESIILLFQRVKRDPTVINAQQISLEHLTDLSQRLELIVTSSDERGRYLDFEDIHWKVQTHFVQLEFFLIALNKKFADSHQTDQLFSEYQVWTNSEDPTWTIREILEENPRGETLGFDRKSPSWTNAQSSELQSTGEERSVSQLFSSCRRVTLMRV